MFALARNTMLARRAATQLRTKATMHPQEIIKKNNQFKKQWLSDPATYPIILIMGCGGAWLLAMGANALLTYKDVQLNPNNRGAVMKDWSKEHRTTVMERFANMKGGVAAEGLGVDHEEWAKKKQEYLKK